MSKFAEEVVQIIPGFYERLETGRRPERKLDNDLSTRLAKAAFPVLVEIDRADVPKPSIDNRKALWDWYVDLSFQEYYIPPNDFDKIIPQR